ncbi:hypothetical protein BDV12DRAFT_203134 [Aspergillus spectabilis]
MSSFNLFGLPAELVLEVIEQFPAIDQASFIKMSKTSWRLAIGLWKHAPSKKYLTNSNVPALLTNPRKSSPPPEHRPRKQNRSESRLQSPYMGMHESLARGRLAANQRQGPTPPLRSPWAVDSDNPGMAEALIAQGVDVNHSYPGLSPPLIMATKMGYGFVVDALLAAGADVHIRVDIPRSSTSY